MQKKKLKLFGIFALCLSLFSPALPAQTLPFDHSLWDQFLKTYVNDQGDVDYFRVKQNPKLLEDYLRIVAETAGGYKGWPREERLALFLNLYHAAVIHQILEYYPVKTIQEIPGIWDLPAVKVGEHFFSLNQLRDKNLIEIFRDEKIDAVLSFGAKDAPRLRQEAFTGPRVEGQLYVAAREFVNDPRRNPLEINKKHLHLSRVFKWYAKNFKLDFGFRSEDSKFSDEENAVLAFLVYYLDDREKIDYLEKRNYKIRYLPFNWALNDWRANQAAGTS